MLSGRRRVRGRRPLAARAEAIELLDQGRLSLSDVERNLADLARLNRLPGGAAASMAGIGRLIAGVAGPRVLDVGTGAGDLPRAFARRGWRAVAIDINPDVLLVARRETAGEPGVDVRRGDALALPFEDGSFDVAHASLLLHHFGPADALRALRELRRVAVRGIVVNDLRRGLLPLIATAVSVAALGRSAVTRSDGILSARRAYTLEELDELLDEAGLAVRYRSSPWMPRVVTTAVPT